MLDGRPRRLSFIFVFGVVLVACSAAPDETANAESDLTPSYCSKPKRLLSTTTKTISSQDAVARVRLPTCSEGDATPLASIYRFRVPEPGIVRVGRVEALSGSTPFITPFRALYGTESEGIDIPCDTHRQNNSFRCTPWSESPLTDTRDFQYVKDDLTLAVARVDSDPKDGHTFPITFEPTCGDGHIQDGQDLGVPAFEECEDGARAKGDGCDASCKIEPACDLDVHANAGAQHVVTLPTTCRTARVRATLAPQAVVLVENPHVTDTSVIASVVSGTVPFRGPTPDSGGARWLGVAVGPKPAATANWSCLTPGEACNATQCSDGARACRVRYANPGGKTYVRLSNETPTASATISVRIDRNLATVYE